MFPRRIRQKGGKTTIQSFVCRITAVSKGLVNWSNEWNRPKLIKKEQESK